MMDTSNFKEMFTTDEVKQLRQRVAELEGELDDFESDIDTCTQHNVELQLEVTKLTAERDELNNIAENIGDLHHVTLDEWAAMKAERDALKQQIDDLLSAAKYAMQQIGGMQPTKPLVDAFYALKDAAYSVEAIASVKEKQDDCDIPLFNHPLPPDDVVHKYEELLYAVHRKFPDETRHQTALRYIKTAESPSYTNAAREEMK